MSKRSERTSSVAVQRRRDLRNYELARERVDQAAQEQAKLSAAGIRGLVWEFMQAHPGVRSVDLEATTEIVDGEKCYTINAFAYDEDDRVIDELTEDAMATFSEQLDYADVEAYGKRHGADALVTFERQQLEAPDQPKEGEELRGP